MKEILFHEKTIKWNCSPIHRCFIFLFTHTHKTLIEKKFSIKKKTKTFFDKILRTISIIFDEQAKWTCDNIFRSKAILLKSNKTLNWIIVYCLCQLKMMISIFFLGKFLKKNQCFSGCLNAGFSLSFLSKSHKTKIKKNKFTKHWYLTKSTK